MLMDLFIETLTGAAFELRVSPYETILSVKAKIQRQEGILIGQQHLIWQDKELDDGLSLDEAGIPCGGTLRLVLGMRGGPINTRRVPIEPPSWSDDSAGHSIADIMWPGSSNKLVTLLVLREGDQFNFFRVMDRGDGTITPVAEAVSAGSKRGSHDAAGDEPNGFTGNEDDSSDESSSSANLRGATSAVGSSYRTKRSTGGALSSNKLVHRSSSTSVRSHDAAAAGSTFVAPEQQTPDNDSLHLKMRRLQQKMNQMRLSRDTLTSEHSRRLAPLLPTTSKEDVGVQLSSAASSSRILNSSQNASILNSQDRTHRANIQRREQQSILGLRTAASKPSAMSSDHGTSRSQKLTTSSTSQIRSLPHNISCLPSKVLTPCITTSVDKNSTIASSVSSRLLSGRSEQLPPVILSATRQGTGTISSLVSRPQRCFHCQKKTGLANSYQCRCGNNFCSRHRYAETHNCPYDYKAEGRKLIEEANPVITASKLPKI